MESEMIIKFFIDGNEVDGRPMNGEVYTEKRFVDGLLAVEIETTASTPESRLEQKKEDERAWRNSEVDIVSALLREPVHPYYQELNVYIQALRDYPEHPDFPNGARPERPVTPSGVQIII